MRVEIAEKRFGRQTVLGPIALTIRPGETVALIGLSGIGKTTLLRIVAGVDRSFDGEVSEVGKLAMVFQSPTLLPWRTAAQNLQIATGIDPDRGRALLAEVGLSGKHGHFPGQLSLGQQRRLGLARALAAEPTTLLMDEPFASLDSETTAQMHALTRSVLASRVVATLIVTHDLDAALALADRVVALAGQPATLVKEHRLHPSSSVEGLRSALFAPKSHGDAI